MRKRSNSKMFSNAKLQQVLKKMQKKMKKKLFTLAKLSATGASVAWMGTAPPTHKLSKKKLKHAKKKLKKSSASWQTVNQLIEADAETEA
jgi:hypothetical protein